MQQPPQAGAAADGTTPSDALSPLLRQLSLSARVFFSGELCRTAAFRGSDSSGHLHLVKAGAACLRPERGEAVPIAAPCVLFLPRPSAHSLEPAADSGLELLCASVDLGARLRNPLVAALPELVVLDSGRIGSLAPTLELLFGEAFGEALGRLAALDRLTEYFLIQVLRQLARDGTIRTGILGALAEPRLARAVAAMHERPERPWTLDLLAERAGMSRARFAANFRQATGMSPLAYLTDWRLSIAQNLLRQGLPLKQIAARVGYRSPAALTRAFGRRLGAAPTEWRLADSTA